MATATAAEFLGFADEPESGRHGGECGSLGCMLWPQGLCIDAIQR